ncbi:MAG: c-type cytochrome biogenesis protein CcsB [Lachnospiraceae bacterium]|uniref:c-type cytochrome biogenesis protein CcsB n=1 Tax=unclassified Oribacterium TaxID=2629782 RepID=UPI0005694E39|nr:MULTISPECIES: c-type cytochrome biogenesis protein CcsB [unclassified Oribacterium]MBE6005439.1 c-type cytochrome biogenesis protein CcsB [Lachnospiraceae bacterium]SFG76140.1 cytochrome c-type biogenesis protein CcsB [Oribacterium sp. WCC10]
MKSETLFNLENNLFTVTMLLYFVSMILFFVFFVFKNLKVTKLGNGTLITGFLLHTVVMLIRGINAGRLPITNQYEFASAFAWGLCFVSIIFIYKYKFQALATFSVPVIFLMIGYAAMQSKEVHELMPSLRSNWLGFHVSTAIIAYGAFGVSFAISIMYLLRTRSVANAFFEQHVPSGEKLDIISYRAVSLGVLFLSFCMISGAIWAENAWGSYWSWDPKETWSLVTWFIYFIYLHLRLRSGWKEKRAAWFSIIGFVCVIFTYIGVNTLLPGVHSYA